MSEQPGRYQRTTGGMIGAMIVLLLVVAGFVGFRALNRNDASRPTPAVPADQVSAVTRAAREASMAAPVPTPLPANWRITSVSFNPTKKTWHLGLLTADNQYVGIEERPATPRELARTYIDKDAVQGSDVTNSGRTWTTWTDQGGDYALITQVGSTSYLVGGSASNADVDAIAKAIASSLP